MPSKEKDDAADRSELAPNKSDSGTKDSEFRGQCGPEESGGADDAPWEKRYEKLWVEVEKKDAKSTFKSVAGELKAKFGEVFKSRFPADDVADEQAGSSSAEEDSSDEEDGEIIVRPTARARSAVLLTIPEQRESGPEDSAPESHGSSSCGDRMQDCGQPACDSTICQEPEQLASNALESPSPHLSAAQTESSINHSTKAVSNGPPSPLRVTDRGSFLKDEKKQRTDPIMSDTSASSGDDLKEFAVSQPSSLSRRSASVPGVSDEELEEDLGRFKLEVGMLRVVFLDMEKEKAQLQKEVEDGRPFQSFF